MKTKPLDHQVKGVNRLAENPEHYALGAEQGTGKTWMLLADAEQQFAAGSLDGVLTVAPNGVHTNWVVKEIPEHLGAPWAAYTWHSGLGVRATRTVKQALEPHKGRLVFLAMSINAVNTPKGFKMAQDFLRTHRAMMISDESDDIKNPYSKRTKRMIQLGQLAASRRIASGTMMDRPPDLFSQFEFLAPKRRLLGTTSYRAFVAEFANVLPPNDPRVAAAAERTRPGVPPPQIIARNPDGTEQFRNLELLRERLKPHMFRVLKADCLDLPEKVYQHHYFQLDARQRDVIKKLKEEARFEHENGELTVFKSMAILGKLRQATSGFVLLPDGSAELLPDNARAKAFVELLRYVRRPMLVWAYYREEHRLLAEMMRNEGLRAATYNGDTSKSDRPELVRAFQDGELDALILQQQAGATGLTLTRAETVVYYSNDFSSRLRLQSEDRAHRHGLRHPVVYIDLIGEGTVDEGIVRVLKGKRDLQELLLNDPSMVIS